MTRAPTLALILLLAACDPKPGVVYPSQLLPETGTIVESEPEPEKVWIEKRTEDGKNFTLTQCVVYLDPYPFNTEAKLCRCDGSRTGIALLLPDGTVEGEDNATWISQNPPRLPIMGVGENE